MKRRRVTLYLASKSPRRHKLIRHCGLAVRIVRSRYREKTTRTSANPGALVLRHALGKAREAVLPKKHHAPRLVLGADTIVVYGARILEKPRSRKHAARMLKMLSGKTHAVLTGLALIDPASGRKTTGVARTTVRFKKLDEREIKRYLNAINPLDKAGGYAIQEGPKIVQALHGSRTNVIGLPVELLNRLLEKTLKLYLC